MRAILAILAALLFSILYAVNDSSGYPTAESETKKRIAIVEPTFTHAAYQNGSFYNFYQKYTKATPGGMNITTDIHLLDDRPVPQGPFIGYKHPDQGPSKPHGVFHRAVEEHIKRFDPEANVTKIGDQHVHNGTIFGPDGSNSFDVLVLFHNEYLTQREYDNIRRFVENGGSVLFTMANVLYAEVDYNEKANTIMLVKGHDWEFDGKVARKSVSERWFNDTREWVGSNFMKIPTFLNVQFRNNVFNYTHTEEQYVTNNNSRILLDYGAYMPENPSFNSTVASYELESGMGKVVMIGLFTNRLLSNQSFWEFFDNIILPRSILSPYQDATLFQAAAENVPKPSIYWKLNTGNIAEFIIDERFGTMHISLERMAEVDDTLLLILPKNLIQDPANIKVQTNGDMMQHQTTECDSDIALKIPVSGETDQIKILYNGLIAG